MRRRQSRRHCLATDVAALEVDLLDLARVSELAGGRIGQNCLGRHAVPEFIADGHELIGEVIAFVVRHLHADSVGHVLGVAEAGDDVPADASAAQVVERRDPAGGQVRRGASSRQRDTDAQVLSRCSHHGHQRHWVMVGPRRTVLHRRHHAVLVDRMRGGAVGEEHAVEAAALQRARQTLPVGKILQPVELAILRVGPAEQRVRAGGVDQHLHQVHFWRHRGVLVSSRGR